LGCVPLYNLMEDAATAEISRTQVWQWVHNPRGLLEDGRKVTLALVRQFIREALERIRTERGLSRFAKGHFPQATQLFEELVAEEQLAEFLTLKAYECLESPAAPAPKRTSPQKLFFRQGGLEIDPELKQVA
jgi:malate synthase